MFQRVTSCRGEASGGPTGGQYGHEESEPSVLIPHSQILSYKRPAFKTLKEQFNQKRKFSDYLVGSTKHFWSFRVNSVAAFS